MERDAEPADACAGQQQPHLRLLPEGPPHADQPEDARPQRQQAEVQLSSDVGGAGQARAGAEHPGAVGQRDVRRHCAELQAAAAPVHQPHDAGAGAQPAGLRLLPGLYADGVGERRGVRRGEQLAQPAPDVLQRAQPEERRLPLPQRPPRAAPTPDPHGGLLVQLLRRRAAEPVRRLRDARVAGRARQRGGERGGGGAHAAVAQHPARAPLVGLPGSHEAQVLGRRRAVPLPAAHPLRAPATLLVGGPLLLRVEPVRVRVRLLREPDGDGAAAALHALPHARERDGEGGQLLGRRHGRAGAHGNGHQVAPQGEPSRARGPQRHLRRLSAARARHQPAGGGAGPREREHHIRVRGGLAAGPARRAAVGGGDDPGHR
mmetsp:Transcript_37687/g.72225  ORF Transcript_37687/g.72225 Transcript_37687/m.72225 type:complete len:375 (-) Transcript_37687:2397-3521(-)